MFPRFPFFGQRGAGRLWPLYGLVRPVGGAWKSCGGRTKRSSFSQCNALTQLAHCTRGSKRIRRRLIMDGRRLLLLLLCVLQLSRLVRSTVLEGGEQLFNTILNSVESHLEFVKCFALARFNYGGCFTLLWTQYQSCTQIKTYFRYFVKTFNIYSLNLANYKE